MADAELFNGLQVEVLAVQFIKLVLQPVNPVADIATCRQRLCLVQQGLPLLCGLTHQTPLFAVAGIGIEQVQLGAACHQRLLVVLAMHFDQEAGQLAELADGGRTAVDPRTRAAIGADHPAQLAMAAVLVQFVAAQPLQRRTGSRQLELGGQLGALAAVADHAAVGTGTGQQGQGIDHQRFAGAGFTGNNRHAGAKFQFGLTNDRKILDR